MKRTVLLIAILFFSFGSFAQSKADSIAQAKQQKAIQEIISKTPIVEFNQFLYENLTAKQYNEFVQYYNAFIRNKYLEAEKPKTTK